MDFRLVYILFKKELDEIVRSKYVLFSLLFMPAFFFILSVTSTIAPVLSGTTGEADPLFSSLKFTDNWNELSIQQKFFIISAEMGIMMLLFLPLILPNVIAADTFAGERDRGTAEGIVASPLTESEIYLGKICGALLPSLIPFWLFMGLYAITIDYYSKDVLGFYYYPNIRFVLFFLFLGPLFGFATTNVMVWVSTRTSTSRDAQQLGGLVIMPLIFILFGTFVMAIMLSWKVLLIVILVLIILNYILGKIGMSILDRENWIK
ncbi:MAG: ABC transporter permease [Candidatus Heimdallarchaeota archaeon]|nr:ABC transporter permease [Candidatus Heimdallarchaeota archaeon]MDH5647155.1 ABC transporter permease [Candidatus Heimdallarchaeota archaeon]